MISMLFHRRSLHPLGALCFIVILWYSVFPIAFYGPSLINGIQNPAEYGAFGTSITNDSSLSSHHSFGCMCTKPHSFFSPSSLSGFSDEENNDIAAPLVDQSSHQCDGTLDIEPTQPDISVNNKSWSADFGMFRLIDGGIVFCSLNSREEKDCLLSRQIDGADRNNLSSCRSSFLRQKTIEETEVTKPVYGSSLPNVEITPPCLDWGSNYLYFSSTALLTMKNTCNNSVLHIYNSFSTDTQFFSCDFSEISIGPGESTSLCFVFLPRLLGEFSAHLVLQTSIGGFVIKTKGYAIESPLVIRPLNGLDVSSDAKLSNNLSLFNSFNETIYVEEVTAWILVSQGQNSHLTEAVCSINSSQVVDMDVFVSVKDWLAVRSGGISSPTAGIRAQRNWEISPHTSETVMETEFSVGLNGKVIGAFCLQLLRASKNKSDIVMVPFEAELQDINANSNLLVFVSPSLESLVDEDTGQTIVTISLKNDGQDILSFVKVIEHSATMVFQIKYSGGLLLSPSSITQVAAITCANHTELHLSFGIVSNLHQNCKLLLQTNASSTPQIEISCQDIICMCTSHKRFASVEHKDKTTDVDSSNTRSSYEGSTVKLDAQIKTQQIVQMEELMHGNWKSQGTTESMSILKTHEVHFLMIQVGSYISECIALKNPSPHPAVVQHILNSREVSDECRSIDSSSLAPSSRTWLTSDETTTTKHGGAILWPILFCPSNQCCWRSSAMMKGNLSGVECLHLCGFEGSEIIEHIHFNMNVPREKMTAACSRPLSKELCAKNMGDMPLDVKRIEVSGSKCQLDGFVVHSCGGFILEHGESIKLMISYQNYCSITTVHRDLELTMASGVLLIPLKATCLPYMPSNCRRLISWTGIKKSFIVFLLIALVVLCVCCIPPQINTTGSLDKTVCNTGKSSLAHRNHKHSMLLMPRTMNLFRWMLSTLRGYLRVTSTLVSDRETNDFQHKNMEGTVASTRMDGFDVLEASELGNLTIRTVKEKGKRRRKRKGPAAKFNGLFEASSSQSGNSTPSSPLSPFTAVTSNHKCKLSLDVEQSMGTRNPFARVAEKSFQKGHASVTAAKTKTPEPKVAVKNCNPPGRKSGGAMLMPSATFPSANRATPYALFHSPLLASTSRIPLHDRAPGSKFSSPKSSKPEEKAKPRDEYAYDIWGDHFSGLHLRGSSKSVAPLIHSPAENKSNSFFIGGPQILTTASRPKSVLSFNQEG